MTAPLPQRWMVGSTALWSRHSLLNRNSRPAPRFRALIWLKSGQKPALKVTKVLRPSCQPAASWVGEADPAAGDARPDLDEVDRHAEVLDQRALELAARARWRDRPGRSPARWRCRSRVASLAG